MFFEVNQLIGGKVNLNPIITIIVVVPGNEVWGVVGMLVTIPALGIEKLFLIMYLPLILLLISWGMEIEEMKMTKAPKKGQRLGLCQIKHLAK